MKRMTWWLAGVMLLATGASAQQVEAPSLGATNYAYDGAMAAPATRPSFGDEFNGAIDQRRWRWDTGQNKTGWPNHELQYYAGPDRTNARIEKGALVVEARAAAFLCHRSSRSRLRLARGGSFTLSKGFSRSRGLAGIGA